LDTLQQDRLYRQTTVTAIMDVVMKIGREPERDRRLHRGVSRNSLKRCSHLHVI